MALFLSLYEVELHHETSVKRNKHFTNPSLKQLIEELELDVALPWPLPLLMLAGETVIPDPYAFWYGKPKTDKRSCLRKWCCCCFWTSPCTLAWRAFRRVVRRPVSYTHLRAHET